MTECYFIPKNDTSSATICSNCGREKMLHIIGSGVKDIPIYKEEPNYNMKQEIIAEMERLKKEEPISKVAERILANNIDGLREALNDDDLFFFYKGVIINYGEAMIKWQQENTNINALDFEIDYLKKEIKVLKHQQERMYNEEELLTILQKYRFDFSLYRNIQVLPLEFSKWFEQFKKK